MPDEGTTERLLVIEPIDPPGDRMGPFPVHDDVEAAWDLFCASKKVFGAKTGDRVRIGIATADRTKSVDDLEVEWLPWQPERVVP